MTVECEDCGTPVSQVEAETVANGMVWRIVECACGARFETAEKIVRRLPSPRQIGKGVPQTTSNHVISSGGEGGALLVSRSSDVKVEVIPPGSSSKPLARARVGRGRSLKYPPEFEDLLAACEQWRGNKGAAYDAWVKNNAPLFDVVGPVYAKWRLTDQWQRGFVPHLSTWLNARGWEKMPNAEEMAGPRAEPRSAPLPTIGARQEEFRRQAATAARVARVKADLGADRRPPPPSEVVRALANGKVAG